MAATNHQLAQAEPSMRTAVSLSYPSSASLSLPGMLFPLRMTFLLTSQTHIPNTYGRNILRDTPRRVLPPSLQSLNSVKSTTKFSHHNIWCGTSFYTFICWLCVFLRGWPSLLSIAMLTHCPKTTQGGEACTSWWQSVTEENQGRKTGEGTEARISEYSLLAQSPCKLSLLSYMTHRLLPRDGAAYSGLGTPTSIIHQENVPQAA